jgi:hypothetical protein
LPDWAIASSVKVDCTSGRAFDCPHDFYKRNNHAATFVDQWRKNDVDMIGHHDCHSQAVAPFMIVYATAENNVSRPVGKGSTEFCAKGDEVRSVITLHVRQVTAVELHLEILAVWS